MKKEVIEKLFNGEQLEGEELVYVAKSLKDDKDIISIPYNHDKEDYLEACGITKADIDKINEGFTKFQKQLREEQGEGNKAPSVSRLAEEVERLSLADEKNMRAMSLAFIIVNLTLQQKQNPLSGLLGRLLKDLGDD